MLRNLTPEEERVIIYKGTERPFSGQYYEHDKTGTYLCKRCGAELFSSSDKFHSGCGWPSFDNQIQGAIKFLPDEDGMRTEIQCSRCGAHLGHLFEGEGLTPKNLRYCVNSISLNFIETTTKEIVLGGGCFWCMEAVFQRLPGVTKVTSGYSGGATENPTYKDVSDGTTGHAEVIKIEYVGNKVSIEQILELFFSIHDPTTKDRQGADCGSHYRSIIFYTDEKEKEIISCYIEKIKNKYSDPIVTEITPAATFYEAEEYHKNYYDTHKQQPYCAFVIEPKIRKALKKIKPEMN